MFETLFSMAAVFTKAKVVLSLFTDMNLRLFCPNASFTAVRLQVMVVVFGCKVDVLIFSGFLVSSVLRHGNSSSTSVLLFQRIMMLFT
jgi:hypothetical protein